MPAWYRLHGHYAALLCIQYALDKPGVLTVLPGIRGKADLEEILFNTKAVYVDSGVFSPVTVLFNSELFSTILHIEERQNDKKEIEPKRNELCPCGSGLKYKKCCGKN